MATKTGSLIIIAPAEVSADSINLPLPTPLVVMPLPDNMTTTTLVNNSMTLSTVDNLTTIPVVDNLAIMLVVDNLAIMPVVGNLITPLLGDMTSLVLTMHYSSTSVKEEVKCRVPEACLLGTPLPSPMEVDGIMCYTHKQAIYSKCTTAALEMHEKELEYYCSGDTLSINDHVSLALTLSKHNEHVIEKEEEIKECMLAATTKQEWKGICPLIVTHTLSVHSNFITVQMDNYNSQSDTMTKVLNLMDAHIKFAQQDLHEHILHAFYDHHPGGLSLDLAIKALSFSMLYFTPLDMFHTSIAPPITPTSLEPLLGILPYNSIISAMDHNPPPLIPKPPSTKKPIPMALAESSPLVPMPKYIIS